ncbi:MAG: LysM peptidoglycan-binding domain-containing protein [Elusimicrobia bacterium]|jgi:nucleoid-associated protein YgaU|nr:LysM peptidoglycan-binding domain-containing protein [Elusimicrobiota bacterium]
MRKYSIVSLIFLGLIILASGCTKKGKIPSADVSGLEAERAIVLAESEINEAKDLGADTAEASEILQEAKDFFNKEDFSKAKIKANLAGASARRLKESILAKEREVTDAKASIKEAGELIKELDKLGGDTGSSKELLIAAESEFEAENYIKANESAVESIRISKERIGALKTGIYVVGTWARDRDCLWNIAGKENIYNDSWKWKRIYKANSKNIKDPNLIYPGQNLVIPGR